ncbi:DUF308 domain-containing protein, partial [Streptomyces sp. NPDC048279]|uniref:DUF308 domain-containing protein n=1 Tax=Streptomyces sp. NPDC048279 TaxID=3154714 RepID=UPI00342CA77F
MTEPPSTGPADDDRTAHIAPASAAAPASAPASTPAHTPATASRHEPEPPFEGPLHALSKAAWQTVLLTGIASLVLGVLVLVWPGASLLAAGVLFGIYLLISGIGRATAFAFAEAGARVVAVDRDAEAAART